MQFCVKYKYLFDLYTTNLSTMKGFARNGYIFCIEVADDLNTLLCNNVLCISQQQNSEYVVIFRGRQCVNSAIMTKGGYIMKKGRKNIFHIGVIYYRIPLYGSGV